MTIDVVITLTENNGDANYHSIDEIELRSTLGGADQTTPSTVITASSEFSGSAVAELMLDDTTAYWISSSTATQTITITMPDSFVLAELALRPENSGVGRDRAPRSFTVHVDGVLWGGFTNEEYWILGSFRAFQSNTIDVDIVISSNNGDGTYHAIGDVELRALVGGPDRTTTETRVHATSAGFPTTAEPARMVDNANPYWLSDSNAEQTLTFKMPADFVLAEVAITNENSASGPNRSPKDFKIYNRGHLVADITDETAWTQNEQREFAVSDIGAVHSNVTQHVSTDELLRRTRVSAWRGYDTWDTQFNKAGGGGASLVLTDSESVDTNYYKIQQSLIEGVSLELPLGLVLGFTPTLDITTGVPLPLPSISLVIGMSVSLSLPDAGGALLRGFAAGAAEVTTLDISVTQIS